MVRRVWQYTQLPSLIRESSECAGYFALTVIFQADITALVFHHGTRVHQGLYLISIPHQQLHAELRRVL